MTKTFCAFIQHGNNMHHQLCRLALPACYAYYLMPTGRDLACMDVYNPQPPHQAPPLLLFVRHRWSVLQSSVWNKNPLTLYSWPETVQINDIISWIGDTVKPVVWSQFIPQMSFFPGLYNYGVERGRGRRVRGCWQMVTWWLFICNPSIL